MTTDPDPDGPLSDAEFAQFLSLLRRYCAYDLDQFENVKAETLAGPVYVMFNRALPPGCSDDAFRPF